MISLPAFTDSPAARRAATARAGRISAVNPDKAHDTELVRRFNSGDASAFLEIFERYRGRMFAVALAMLRSRSDAEEVAQDTFIRAHGALARFRGDSSLATWLHRIALNLARNRYWFLFRRCRHLTLSLDCPLSGDKPGTFSELVAGPEPDPARHVTVEEFSTTVTACMDRLDRRHREILTLRNLLHRSYEDIALSLNISVGTVKSRISRARENLRRLMTEACPEFDVSTPVSSWFEPNRGGAHVA